VTRLRTAADGTWTLPVALDGPARWAATWVDEAGALHRTAVVAVDPLETGRLLAGVP
jgi:hypothetical protein